MVMIRHSLKENTTFPLAITNVPMLPFGRNNNEEIFERTPELKHFSVPAKLHKYEGQIFQTLEKLLKST